MYSVLAVTPFEQKQMTANAPACIGSELAYRQKFTFGCESQDSADKSSKRVSLPDTRMLEEVRFAYIGGEEVSGTFDAGALGRNKNTEHASAVFCQASRRRSEFLPNGRWLWHTKCNCLSW